MLLCLYAFARLNRSRFRQADQPQAFSVRAALEGVHNLAVGIVGPGNLFHFQPLPDLGGLLCDVIAVAPAYPACISHEFGEPSI